MGKKEKATDWVCRETRPEESEEVVFGKGEEKAIPLINVEDKFQAPTSTEKLAASIEEVVEVVVPSEEGPKKTTGEAEDLEGMVCECKATKPKEEVIETIIVENWEGKASPEVNSGRKPQPPTFSDKLAVSIKEVAEVSAAAITVGYKKAEAFVNSEEFKQGVETTKKTTLAVAGGLYRGFGKLIKEVELSVKEVKSKDIPPEDQIEAKKY